MPEIFVPYNKTGDARGTFEIHHFWSHNIYCQYSIYSPSESDFSFFFCRRRYFLLIFSIDFLVSVFANGQESLSNVHKSSRDLSVFFLSIISRT
jgi:hypothetical protein